MIHVGCQPKDGRFRGRYAGHLARVLEIALRAARIWGAFGALVTFCGFSAITLGRRRDMLGEWTTLSYSGTMLTRSRNTALTVSCYDHRDNGK